MQIIPLSEGNFTIDKSKIFVPFNLEADQLQNRPIGSLLVEVQPFVIITEKDVILLDTGLGFPVQNNLQLIQNLQAKNIQPEQVTKVWMSHLHKDHAGGISKKNHLGFYQLSFPNALYYVQKEEFTYAMDTGFPSYMVEEMEVLHQHPQVQWLNGNGRLAFNDYEIEYEITGAHSPYHQICRIKKATQTIFFGADDAPQLQQMKSRFMAKYDYDGKKAMLLRQQWWQEGKEQKWTFLFYHDISLPIYQM
ncbi:MBL fold metallo-hydrolase [Hydrotalea sp.]|uniref:MBL fold metallo-hydrolase n=1 Tax=Hydrotalea sp. TaxID=2881279 RepID=UPI0026017FCD|nr:MBL fold metallo-hydrolase [Hydrotalea sp.]